VLEYAVVLARDKGMITRAIDILVDEAITSGRLS
jgi:hypothetical protein